MLNVKKAFKANVPHYVIRESISSCSCDIDANCDCMPSLYCTMDGYTGYGAAHWTYTDETCPDSISDAGKAYFCNFLGLAPFWATGEMDAAETLRDRLDAVGIRANVQYRNNKHAADFLADLEDRKAKGE